MGTNELLEISDDIRKELEKERVNRQLSFVEETHRYGIYDPINEKITHDMPSVSSLLKKWYIPFDAEKKSLSKMKGDVEEARKLKESWEKMGKDASSMGSYAHYKLEQYVWNLYDIDIETRKPFYDMDDEGMLLAQEMLNNGINLVHKIISNGFVPLDTECIMGSIDLGYFGQCDNLWLGYYKGRLVFLMTDYKTNKTKNFEESFYNKPMLHPFEKMLDTDLNKYCVQQPLYAQLFTDMLKNTKYKDIPFIGFRILHLRDGGKSIKIPKWVYDETKKLYPIN